MKRIALTALALGLLAGSGAAMAAGATTHYYCNVESYDANGQPRYTTYYTPVFAGPKGKHMELGVAFRAYVAQNYPQLDEVKEAQCLFQDDRALADRLWDMTRTDRASRNTMVPVDWKG